MHILIGLVGIVIAVAFWISRAKNAADAVGEIGDAANDARLAVRRFGFKRKLNVHPADSIDDARIAACAIVLAFVDLERDHIQKDDLENLTRQAQSVFGTDHSDAEAIVAAAAWVNSQTSNSSEVIRRLQRKLRDLAGAAAAPDLDRMIGKVAGSLTEASLPMHSGLMRALKS